MVRRVGLSGAFHGPDEEEVRESLPASLRWIPGNDLIELRGLEDPLDQEVNGLQRSCVALERVGAAPEAHGEPGSFERLVVGARRELTALDHERSIGLARSESTCV